MSNPHDPHTPRDPHDPQRPGDPAPRRTTGSGAYTRYIIAGAAVVALVLVVMVFTGTRDVDAPPPDATVESPAPETGAGTTGDPGAGAGDPGAGAGDPGAQPAAPEQPPQ
jgi:hypothetical protein